MQELLAFAPLGVVLAGMMYWVAHLHVILEEERLGRAAREHHSESVESTLRHTDKRVAELEKLWLVAKENPELIRELAAEALKGR